MQPDKIADQFGELLIKEARDRNMRGLKSLRSLPEVNSEYVEAALSYFRDADEETREMAFRLALAAVDGALHTMTWLLHDNSPFEICYKESDGKYEPLNKHSDGLFGDLFGDDGWIARYSEFPRTTR